MDARSFQLGLVDVLLVISIGLGCVLSLPIYWWLLVRPIIHLLKRTRKRPSRRIF